MFVMVLEARNEVSNVLVQVIFHLGESMKALVTCEFKSLQKSKM